MTSPAGNPDNPQIQTSERLLTRVLRGGAILAVGSFFERGLRFVANMILARLLAPDQFGLMALVLAANGLFEVLTEVGIGQSVIQNKKGDTDSFLSAAWIFSSLRGMVLYLIGFMAAPWLAGFYDAPNLTPLMKVAFLTMLFNGLTNPRLYVLQKQLSFLRYVMIAQGSAFIGTLVCLGLAIMCQNVWALVIGYLSQGVFRCLFSYIWCPSVGLRSSNKTSWSELLRFSRGMAGLPLLFYIFMQADILILGRIYASDIIGTYSMVLNLALTPSVMFGAIINPMVLPILSETINREMFRHRFMRLMTYATIFGLPLICLLAVFSRMVLRYIYGDHYVSMSTVFCIFCFYSMIHIYGCIITACYWAMGIGGIDRKYAISRTAILLILLYPFILWLGPVGAAIARLISYFVTAITQFRMAFRHIEKKM